MPTSEALFKAKQKGLDLVEVASQAKPPVCKIVDFNKFKYLENKKQRKGAKKSKVKETKEIRFSPFIAENDFQFRIKRAKEFLKESHKIRLTIWFKGRQITRKQFGYELLEKAVKALEEVSKVESEPKFHGKMLSMVLKPGKGNNAKTENKKISKKKVSSN
jgi:translation initiation factor IF-3